MGLIFNPYKGFPKGMENKFNLYYYANYEFDKTETPKQTLLTIGIFICFFPHIMTHNADVLPTIRAI